MINYSILMDEEFEDDLEEFEDIINDDILPSRRWALADMLRHRDFAWELEYDEFAGGKW